MRVPFYVQTPFGKKCIGYTTDELILGKIVLVKPVTRAEHFCWKFKAWGNQGNSLPEMLRRKVDYIRLEIQDESRVLQIGIERVKRYFNDMGSQYLKCRTTLNTDHGSQVFMPEKEWQELTETKQMALSF